MAKRGRYSNKTKEQADVFIDMMDGDVGSAFNLTFDRAEMFWDEVEEGERDVEDAESAVSLTNCLASILKKRK